MAARAGSQRHFAFQPVDNNPVHAQTSWIIAPTPRVWITSHEAILHKSGHAFRSEGATLFTLRSAAVHGRVTAIGDGLVKPQRMWLELTMSSGGFSPLLDCRHYSPSNHHPSRRGRTDGAIM